MGGDEDAGGAAGRLERRATVGRLAAGVGHELKNLAQVVQAVGEDLREDDPELRDEGAVMLERVGRHLAYLGQHLMRLGVDPGDLLAPVDAGRVAREVHELLRRTGRLSGATVELRTAACPPAHAVASELEHVLINLVADAVEAVEGQPVRRVTIEVGPGPLGVRVAVSTTASACEPGLSAAGPRIAAWGGAVGVRDAPGRSWQAEIDLRPAATAATAR